MDTFLTIRFSNLTVALHTKHQLYTVQNSKKEKKKQKSFQAISNHLPHNPAWTLTCLCCYPHCFLLLPYALSAKQDNHGRSHGISLTGFCERHIIYLRVRTALYLCAHLRAFLAVAYHHEPSPTSRTPHFPCVGLKTPAKNFRLLGRTQIYSSPRPHHRGHWLLLCAATVQAFRVYWQLSSTYFGWPVWTSETPVDIH